jgi:cytochrome P450
MAGPRVSAYPARRHAQCPFPLYSDLRQSAPVVQVEATGDYLVARHEDVVWALQATDRFSNDVGGGAPRANDDGYLAMLNSDPPEHASKRRLAFAPFKPARLRAYEPMVVAAADSLIERFADLGATDLVDTFATPLPIAVMSEMMGLPAEDYPLIRRWSTLEASGKIYLPEEERAVQIQMDMEMVASLRDALTQRRRNPGHDVLSEMIAAQIARDGSYDESVVSAEGAVLLLAGLVTTAHLISSALLVLLENAEEMTAVRGDHSAIPGLLEEVLRVESPVQWRPRRCVKETELGGVLIPVGATVLLLLGSANRDDGCFASADRFQLGRANVKRHVAFGLGPHFCLGAPLARLEGRVALTRLFTRVSELILSVPPGEIEYVESMQFRAPARLPVTFRAGRITADV